MGGNFQEKSPKKKISAARHLQETSNTSLTNLTWSTSLPLEKSCLTQIPELFVHVEVHQPLDHLRPLGHVVDLVQSIKVRAPPRLMPPTQAPPPPPGQHPPTTAAAPAVVH